MKPDGGAFAGFGDTRVSPTWANNNMAYGFFDALFPNVKPNFGSDEPTKRLGDVLLSGKGYMATQNGNGQSAGATYQEHFLYHLLGDPSAQVWTNTPLTLDLSKIVVERIPIPVPDPGGPVFRVRVDIGEQGIATPTVITLYHRGAAIGRGVVGKGAVEITPEFAALQDNLTVAFEQDSALPARKAVEIR